MSHIPVLLNETIEMLALRPSSLVVDCTCGLGGHTGAIARRLESGRVIALDRDAESLEIARENTLDCADRIVFRQSAFSELGATLRSLGVSKADAILADLGVSRMQLTSAHRGLSLQTAGPLDMRLDTRQDFTAGDIVNRWPELETFQLLVEMEAERRNSARKIARALVRARPIRDTAHLAEVVASVVPRAGKIHPATRVFQAIRMRVNDEPAELDSLLRQAPEWLVPRGRFIVIAFHSLDDRKVKLAFRELGQSGRALVLTKHVIKPSRQEIISNPASRSAVLRAVEMN